MKIMSQDDWRAEFGLSDKAPPVYFNNASDTLTTGSVPQAHAIRRAFKAMDLQGVFCHENAPLVYFRVVPRIDRQLAVEMQRKLWNHGVAPILVLIDQDSVHIYSGLSEPAGPNNGDPAGLVQILRRADKELREFILAAQSGEYFRQHRKVFDPEQRVDRHLLSHLDAARAQLSSVSKPKLSQRTIDALLCRLVFTCYLFDRQIIGKQYLKASKIKGATDLRSILQKEPLLARTDLYSLFHKLGSDFNGDLFSADLAQESTHIGESHVRIINDFFQGTDPKSGQMSFWPYDFSIIPIETTSAIYERFLKATDSKKKKDQGAFYTPRILAELVLGQLLEGIDSPLTKIFLDPSCGSGIFLVGLFHRLAEEWDRRNPMASYDARLKGLTSLLVNNIRGIDKNPTACLIAAFSLYLALLDQLSPPDIRQVLRQVKVLPQLVFRGRQHGTIYHGNFFSYPDVEKIDYIVGNPPWATTKSHRGPLQRWCSARGFQLPNNQVAAAFTWKAPEHLQQHGRACFVLPHSILFNHSEPALQFQRKLFSEFSVDRVLNLADYQRFLFEDAEVPSIVLRYSRSNLKTGNQSIDYWSPKADWAAIRTEVISISPLDRTRITKREVLRDLRGSDAPLIWKERYWTTSRDVRFLSRLRSFPRLRDIMDTRGKGQRWTIAHGYEPCGKSDKRSVDLSFSNVVQLEAKTFKQQLFLLPNDHTSQKKLTLRLRRDISDRTIFAHPLVLIKEGFPAKVAYADFDIVYRHGIRGIHGAPKDADLLIFLAAYVRSKLAQYFLFHTSSSWGVNRARVDVADLMRLPFFLPEDAEDPKRARAMVRKVAMTIRKSMKAAAPSAALLKRDLLVEKAQEESEPLINEYFDLDPNEMFLVADTMNIIIPSTRPTRETAEVPSIMPANDRQRREYLAVLQATINSWANQRYRVTGTIVTRESLGLGVVVLEKVIRGQGSASSSRPNLRHDDVLVLLRQIQSLVDTSSRQGAIEVSKGLKVFNGSQLYIAKPAGQRHWSRTSALNDADEIVGTILLRQSVSHGG